MITVISGTNRKDARTQLVAKHYVNCLEKLGEKVHYVSLEDIQNDILHSEMFDANAMKPMLKETQDKYMLPADRWVIVSPEYNGSYPGILKLFIDALSVRAYKETFVGKKVMLVGVASGRAGNLRGIDQLVGVMHHVGAFVFPKMLPISSIENLLDENAHLNKETQAAIDQQIQAFLEFMQ